VSKPQTEDLPSLAEIEYRLATVFPPGATAENRRLTGNVAVRTVFVMLYAGAVADRDVWVRPDQITKMSDRQATRTDGASRERWREESSRPGFEPDSTRWFAPNTRESVRDEVLREGLLRVGAVVQRPGLPTTSAKPRWALHGEFARLFQCERAEFEARVAPWQAAHLSPAARARIALVASGAVGQSDDHLLVSLPNGEARRIAGGPSGAIAKAVVEGFASRFLQRPGVIWMSDSSDKVVARDDALARSVGLVIPPDRLLPDLILVDVPDVGSPVFVFVEIVASEGPMTEARVAELTSLVPSRGGAPGHLRFVTAYLDRDRPEFRRTIGKVAWGTFVWFAAEPDHLMILSPITTSQDRLRVIRAL
jgi:hypothetical protein